MSVSTARCLLVYKVHFLLQIKDKICRECNEGCINKGVVIKYVIRYIMYLMYVENNVWIYRTYINKTGECANMRLSIPLT